MVSITSLVETNALLFTYMFLYNLSLMVLLWSVFTVITARFKTLHALAGFSFNPYHLLLATALLLSMAGVPPFIGFFAKLFVLGLLTNNSFFILYSQFFLVLFLGLYFYIQNIRFLHSTNPAALYHGYLQNERVCTVFYYTSLTILGVVLFGVFVLDDVLLFFV